MVLRVRARGAQGAVVAYKITPRMCWLSRALAHLYNIIIKGMLTHTMMPTQKRAGPGQPTERRCLL